jgi:hypothetical protein
MDFHSRYNKQLEQYKYFQDRLENYVDLSKQIDPAEPNATIKLLADKVFNKNANNLDMDLTGILSDEDMEAQDLFQAILELVLYGLDIITDGSITLFDINDQFCDIMHDLKKYLKSMGLDMKIDEEIGVEDINAYADKTDHYYRIVPKPIKWLCPQTDWYVLTYRMIPNESFTCINTANTMPLSKFKTWFVNKQKKIFTIEFGFAKHVTSQTRCVD